MSTAACLIIVALPEEREAVAKHLENVEMVRGPDGLARAQCYEGALSDGKHRRVAIVELGEQGRASSAAATTSGILYWKPEIVLVVGIAGGIHSKGVRLGDVVAASEVLDYEDQRLLGGTSEMHPKAWPCDSTLIGNAVVAAKRPTFGSVSVQRPENGAPTFWLGTIASGDKFVRDVEFVARLRRTYPQLVGIEKEAAGVALACTNHRHRPRFVVIRAVSDYAEPIKPSPTFRPWREYACHLAAAFAVEVAESYFNDSDAHASSRIGSLKGKACVLGLRPRSTACCHFEESPGDSSPAVSEMTRLARPIASLCRRRFLLVAYAALLSTSATIFRLAAGPSQFVNATFAAGLLIGGTCAWASIHIVGLVADGIALKGNILAGHASDGDVEAFLATAKGWAVLAGRLSGFLVSLSGLLGRSK